MVFLESQDKVRAWRLNARSGRVPIIVTLERNTCAEAPVSANYLPIGLPDLEYWTAPVNSCPRLSCSRTPLDGPEGSAEEIE
jgi:hypothetical protein